MWEGRQREGETERQEERKRKGERKRDRGQRRKEKGRRRQRHAPVETEEEIVGCINKSKETLSKDLRFR